MNRGGATPDELLRAYPHLELAQIHDALSYYFDHKEEIDQDIEDDRLSEVMRRNNLRYLPHVSGRFGRLLTEKDFEELGDEEKQRALTWDTLPKELKR